jgi:hypothetical protein
VEPKLKGNAGTVGLVMLAVVVIVLVTMLVIGWVEGDPTNHRGDHRPPDKTPSSTFPTATQK